MPYDLIIAGVFAALALGMLISKTSASLGIFALCAGVVLHDSVIATLQTELLTKLPIDSSTVTTALLIVLVVLLPGFVLFHFRGSQSSRVVSQFLPSVTFGAVLMVLFLSRVSIESRQEVVASSYLASQVLRYETALVLVGILSAFSEQLSLHRPSLRKKSRR